MSASPRSEIWPALPLEAWGETYATLHLWTQIVGKVRLVQSQWLNHSWHVPLYVTARGLTTSPIPYGSLTFEIDFDFVDHALIVRTSDGRSARIALKPQSVAAFYAGLMTEMRKLDLPVRIQCNPNEVAEPIRFDEDATHCAYDAGYANRFWRILVQADRVFKVFRGRFVGKCSPVHFFWAGFAAAAVRPAAAFYSKELGEFILPYDAVRLSDSPDDTLLEFLQTTYAAAADLGHWDRPSLEVGRSSPSP